MLHFFSVVFVKPGQVLGRTLRVVLMMMGVLVLLGGTTVQSKPLVKDVIFTARSDGEGYVVRVRTADTIKAYSMPRVAGDDELEWVLYNADLHDDFQEGEPEGAVQDYSVTPQNGHVVLRFDLDPDRPVEAQAYRDGTSSDLLLNLARTGRAPVAEAGPSDEGSRSTGEAGDAVQNVSNTPRPSNGPTQEARERWKLDTVVIDPGHGGKDPGATANGLQEKDIVLDIAHELGGYIENRLGVDVVYTRSGDRFIPLEERGHMANEAGAKLFISLHVNSARARAAHGTETYFLGPSKSEAAEKVMERENSVIKYEDDTERYEEYDEQALVRQTLTQSTYMRQSQELASIVQTQFEERVSRHNRGVHQAGFYVLWSASMPSVLVELGFLTNPREARFLNSDRGKTYLASAIFRAVRSYKSQYEKGIFASE